MTNVPFPLRSNSAAVRFMGEPRLVNVYPEEIGQENRAPVAWHAIPGTSSFWTEATSPCRGLMYAPGFTHLYSLHGATVHKVASAGTASALTGIVAGTEPIIWDTGPDRYRQADVTITVASPAVVTWTGHRLVAGEKVRFYSSGELPTGLAIATDYYVIASGLTADTFQVSTSAGGSAVNTTGMTSGTITATHNKLTRQIVIVSDTTAYCIEDDKIISIQLPEDEVVTAVTYLAGRFIFSFASGRNFYSDINDATVIGALSYFTSESRPDGMVRAFADGGQLYLFGENSTEVYAPASDGDAPFVPLGGTFINKGCASKHTVASFDNAPHWLGHDGAIYRVAGYEAKRISTHTVERAIKAVSDKTTIRAWVDTDEGHAFYILTCPQWTWVYDAATGVWHERQSRNRPDWRAYPGIAAWGRRIVGDKASVALRTLDSTVMTDAGEAIRAELTLPDIPGRMTHHRLELDVATGVGNASPSALGHDPQIMLSWSDDGGHTWSNERILPVGKQGQYDTTVKFGRLGTAKTIRGRRYRIAHSERVVKSFLLGDIDAEPLAA